jgi:hypothetical protein
LGNYEQAVQTLPKLWAYPATQMHLPLTNSSLAWQNEHAEPSAVGLDPEGQITQAPLTLANPARQVQA